MNQLRHIIPAMRPQKKTLARYMRKIIEHDREVQDRLYNALARVMKADGKVLPSESDFLAEMERLRQLASEQREEELRRFFENSQDDEHSIVYESEFGRVTFHMPKRRQTN